MSLRLLDGMKLAAFTFDPAVGPTAVFWERR
jgi:hypothetical protein